MLASSRQKLLDAIGSEDRVLDIGGWADPFWRADWVIDLMPYETRGLYAQRGWVESRAEDERFSADTWIARDVCDREPYPFEDGFFDFVVCSHTLEDVRDPVWVCREMARIGRAGYIEVPSRLEEQTYGFQGPWVGWGHHHWLIEINDGSIDFIFKHHILHGMPDAQFPPGYKDSLTPEERVEQLWWEGSFAARERIIVEPAELDAYLTDLVATRAAPHEPVRRRRLPGRARGALRSRVASALRRRRPPRAGS